jgi:hypothetical protein
VSQPKRRLGLIDGKVKVPDECSSIGLTTGDATMATSDEAPSGQHRDRLRDLNTRLLRLHGVLLDRERRAYEDRHGSVPSYELFQLVLYDAQFTWLRSLSGMIANLDAIVDADEPISPENLRSAFREVFQLLKSGEGGDFQAKYIVALQESPDVIMAHAAVSRVLSAAPRL